MTAFIRSTFLAKHCAVDTGAFLVDLHTVTAQAALFTPTGGIEIAGVTIGAMGSLVCSTFYTNHHAVGTGAFFVDLHTIGAQTALFAPALNNKITLIAAGAMGALLICTFQTHIVANLLGGAAVADFRA